MKLINPENIPLSQLKLAWDYSTEGNIEFDWTLIEEICDASGIEVSEFHDERGDDVCGLVHQWYAEHLAHGGEKDPVMEEIILQAKIEESLK
ncbi:hypothetical protein [Nitrosovibrio tenuis]|uniref:Uncharacterized protein n=1 Tax=Nitrosovibrio tenuis TaxID=1233 RepID=A0A1H7NP29_9PROT|nr:hypothetical protein [Nitrosovibrio tenuis]SEL25029.1 hypothetical protein SAMN05216387_10782 [Nitrosovibrio tenuis]